MKVDKLIVSAFVAAILGLEAWTLKSVVDVKVQVAELSARVSVLSTPIANTKSLAQK